MNELKKILKTGLASLWYLVGSIPFISWCVVFYWLHHFKEKDAALRKHRYLTSGIYLSSFFTFFIVLFVGIRRCLFLIPWEWGWHDDGAWASAREYITTIIAAAIVWEVGRLFEAYEYMQKKIEKDKEEQPR